MSSGPVTTRLLLLTLGSLAGATAHAQTPPDSVYTDSWDAMGTTFRVEVVASSRVRAEWCITHAREEIERVEQLLSDYRTTSELSRVNREARVTVDPEFFRVLARIDTLVSVTGGAFDPAVGHLVDAWGFRTGRVGIPPDTTLARARRGSGWSHVTLDAGLRAVDIGTARLDPGAFGKGYALDQASIAARACGIEAALFDAGGSSFLAWGRPGPTAEWTVDVGERTAESDAANPVRRQTALNDEALSVSGQSGRFFKVGGVPFGHVIDPRSGIPARAHRLVAVRAGSAFVADAVSTALYVLGIGTAKELLDRAGGTGALFIDHGRLSPIGVGWPSH